MAFGSIPKFWRKEKPTARSLLAVGSGDSLKIALLHPIPSSRRHVIRVDVIVAVVVIRLPFWMDAFINRYKDTFGEEGRPNAKLRSSASKFLLAMIVMHEPTTSAAF
jgi:hypothetical protein